MALRGEVLEMRVGDAEAKNRKMMIKRGKYVDLWSPSISTTLQRIIVLEKTQNRMENG